MRNLTAHNQSPQLLAEQAARRLSYDYQLERWERLQQCAADLEASTALYFSKAHHPAQDIPEFADWLQMLLDGEEQLSVWMADCIDKLSALQEGIN